MKRLSVVDKILYFLNLLVIGLLLVACFVPIIKSEFFSFLSFLGLLVPVLVVANLIFVFYWLLKRSRKVFGSIIVLCISYFSLGAFYMLNFSEQEPEGDLKVMSYNVRSFNMYEEMPSKTVLEDIKAFVKKEDPDIICIQEPYYDSSKEFKNFRYRYLDYFHMQGKGLLAIFSKYPIVNNGLLNLPRTDSNAVFVDVVYKKDTIRIYNAHLESLGITPGQGVLSTEPTDKLFKQVSYAFRKQTEQAKVIGRHIKDSPYKAILCGDFNNGQFSNIYRIIKGDLQDSFLERGSGYGQTYNFHGIPFRIDFILADSAFKVATHHNYKVEYSDHFPVMASFNMVISD